MPFESRSNGGFLELLQQLPNGIDSAGRTASLCGGDRQGIPLLLQKRGYLEAVDAMRPRDGAVRPDIGLHQFPALRDGLLPGYGIRRLDRNRRRGIFYRHEMI